MHKDKEKVPSFQKDTCNIVDFSTLRHQLFKKKGAHSLRYKRFKRLDHRFFNKKRLNLFSILPHMLTIMSICCGMTGVRFALFHDFKSAVIAILLGACLDGLDGRLARLLGTTSKFGAQLDSFADLISFGVAPSLILATYALHPLQEVGWCIALLFSICMTLRLARFNVQSEAPTNAVDSLFFTGVPAPMAAFLGLSPLMAHFAFPDIALFKAPLFIASVMIIVSFLMISHLPLFSFKKVHLHQRWFIPLTLFVFVIGAGIYSAPWKSLTFFALFYCMAIIPYSIKKYKKMKRDLVIL